MESPGLYGLTAEQYAEMIERGRRAARYRLFLLESSNDLRDWAFAQLTRVVAIEQGSPYPGYSDLQREFEAPVNRGPLEVGPFDNEGLETGTPPSASSGYLGGPPVPIRGDLSTAKLGIGR